MRTLEICSGENASFSSVARGLGFETLTIDCNPRCGADVCEDIRTWDYKAFPPDYFAVVWASPLCDQMSICNSSKPGLETADEVSKKILEICAYFNAYAFVENPYSARPHMSEYKDFLRVVNYCTYSEDGDVFPYAKKTAVYDLKQSPWTPRAPVSRNPSITHDSFRKPREQHLVLTFGLAADPEETVRLRRRDSECLVEIVRRCVVLARQFRDDPLQLARVDLEDADAG